MASQTGGVFAGHPGGGGPCTIEPFRTPTKADRALLRQQDAQSLRERARLDDLVENADEGIAASCRLPGPLSIVEWPAMRTLAESGALVIAAGGGGIPVIRARRRTLRGVEAVIDKDLRGAETGQPGSCPLTLVLSDRSRGSGGRFRYAEAANPGRYLARRDEAVPRRRFSSPAGSMGPKVEAALEFLEGGGERAIITSSGKTGSSRHRPEDRHPVIVDVRTIYAERFAAQVGA